MHLRILFPGHTNHGSKCKSGRLSVSTLGVLPDFAHMLQLLHPTQDPTCKTAGWSWKVWLCRPKVHGPPSAKGNEEPSEPSVDGRQGSSQRCSASASPWQVPCTGSTLIHTHSGDRKRAASSVTLQALRQQCPQSPSHSPPGTLKQRA